MHIHNAEIDNEQVFYEKTSPIDETQREEK